MLILIAGKHVVLRNALKHYLQRHPGLEIAGTAADKEELMRQIEIGSSDLLLLDENLVEDPLLEILYPLQQIDSNLPVIILGNRAESSQMYLEAGADSFIDKGTPPKALLAAIEEIRLEDASV